LIIGRVVYGIGGENMSVVQSAIVSKWFAGKEMAFALGYVYIDINVDSTSLYQELGPS
jgi:MFS family permease